MTLKACLLLSAAFAGVTFASPTLAQDSGAPAAKLDEVIVTAQRREENVQKASVSIAAISPQMLVARGITDSQSLNGVVPGLKLAYTGPSIQTFIRGVGDATANAYSQPGVALNLDGVYIARQSAFGAVFFDTARVEVLRGPQGTLYGRNTSGGAINVISNSPKLGEYSGMASLEGGNYSLFRAQGVANLPVSDTLALRVAAQATHRDGYLSDGSNDDVSSAVRGKALWEPSDAFSLLLEAEHATIGGKGSGRVYRPGLFGSAYTSSQDTRITPAIGSGLYLRTVNSADVKSDRLSAEANWKINDAVTLTVIPAYLKVDNVSNTGGDFLYYSQDHSKQYSLEGRLGGSTDRLKWVVGAYAFKENMNVHSYPDQRTMATLSGQIQDQLVPKLDTTSYAGFGEATFSVTDQFRLVGGLRYTTEKKDRTGRQLASTYTNNVITKQVFTSLVSNLSAHAVTWKGGVEFDVAPENMLYATVSKGFKAGGFDAGDGDSFRPEYVTAYTVGSKNRFLNDTLQANLEGFYWKYKDQQTAFLGFDNNGNINFLTRNAGQATIYGADLDIVWKPTANDTLSAGGEYLHTNYDKFLYTTVGATPAGTLLADGCISAGPTGKPGQFVEDCSGHPLPRTPKWSGNARYQHLFELADGGNITAGIVAKYESFQYVQVNWLSPNFAQKAYTLWDADITYNAPNGRWSLAGWVRNIGDQTYYLTASNATVPPTSGPTRTSVDAIGAPRTYGVRIQANF